MDILYLLDKTCFKKGVYSPFTRLLRDADTSKCKGASKSNLSWKSKNSVFHLANFDENAIKIESKKKKEVCRTKIVSYVAL